MTKEIMGTTASGDRSAATAGERAAVHVEPEVFGAIVHLDDGRQITVEADSVANVDWAQNALHAHIALVDAARKTRTNLAGLSNSEDDVFAAMVRRLDAALTKAKGE